MAELRKTFIDVVLICVVTLINNFKLLLNNYIIYTAYTLHMSYTYTLTTLYLSYMYNTYVHVCAVAYIQITCDANLVYLLLHPTSNMK